MTLGETTLEQNINGSEERQHKIQDADEFRKALAKSKGALTQEERRALFHKKAEVGRRKNDTAWKLVKLYVNSVRSGKYSLEDALVLMFAEGCDYGKEHAEELKIFDHEED